MPPAVHKINGISTRVTVEHLTQSSFQSFGAVIENPSDTSQSLVTTYHNVSSANHGTAVKYAKIAPLRNTYSDAPSRKQAEPIMSLFVCSPRSLKFKDENSLAGFYELTVMERHPYSTQTFVPLGLNPTDRDTAYIIIVAPSSTNADDKAGPDEVNIKAFLGRGSQAVTYGIGTWHAPMVVIGQRPISFVVTQFTNGVELEDCEERIIEPQMIEIPLV